MLGFICLYWIGLTLSAPTWYFVLIGIGLFCRLISYGMEMYKKGKDAK